MKYSNETEDLFPDMPKDPVPPRRADEHDVPEDVRSCIRGLKKLRKERHRTAGERLQYDEAVRLLIEGWGPR